MIDFERFAQTIEVTMPLINGRGVYRGRRVYVPHYIRRPTTGLEEQHYDRPPHVAPNRRSTTTPRLSGQPNGLTSVGNEQNAQPNIFPSEWYRVSLGIETKILRRATALERRKALLGVASSRVFTVLLLGTEGIATNTDIFYKRGLTESIQVQFANEPLFTTAKVVQWEDGRFYFFETILPRNREVVRGVKERFEQEQDLLGLRGVTPELRYYYLLANLQRQSYRAAEEIERLTLSRAEKDRRIREFQSTFAGRIKESIERAGASLVKYSKYGSGWLVEWVIDGQHIKSIIHDDLRLISAGFCLSGDDKRHTLNSIVNLARLFRRESFLNITRE